MYRHLLVPLDGTELSIQLVGNAVGMAVALGARVTFFHAVACHCTMLYRAARASSCRRQKPRRGPSACRANRSGW